MELTPAAATSISVTLDSLSKLYSRVSSKVSLDFLFPLLLLGAHFIIQLSYFHELGRFISDSGKEVMAPQLLLDGGVLYRDVFWLYGPWAPYFNTLMYAGFGVHTDVLLWVAKLLGAGVFLGVYRCLRTLSSAGMAFTGAMSVLAFSCTSGYFAWPYSFSNLWATCMALFAISSMAHWQTTKRTRHLVISGICATIVVTCKFIIVLPILVSMWLFVLLSRRKTTTDSSTVKDTRLVSAAIYTLSVILVFAAVTWFFSQFIIGKSYLLQAGAGFHAHHLVAAGLYERFLETVFLQNGTSRENISAALAILICPASVIFGWATWIFFWLRSPELRTKLVLYVPFYAFALGNLLQMNSSVHSSYVFPASAILLFSSLELWRTQDARISVARIATGMAAIILLCSLALGAGRLSKLDGDSYPLTSSQFTFKWPNAQGLILQNLASDIREQTSPADKIIIFNTFDYLYLLCERKPALGYFYTWYEPFHDQDASHKVEQALQSKDVTLCLTHLSEPFALAFAPDYRAHPIYQTLKKEFEPHIDRERWGEFIVWKRKTGSVPSEIR